MAEETSTEEMTTEEIEKAINAMEMAKGRLYQTWQSKARYFVEFISIDTMKDRVSIRAYFPQHAEWRQVYVDTTYKMRELTEKEQTEAYQSISRSTATTREQFAKVRAKSAKSEGAGSRARGVKSGLTMLESWGKYFAEFGHREGGRELIRVAMKEEFPQKQESVDRWLDAYRSYYNKGRLPGVKAPETAIELKAWLGK